MRNFNCPHCGQRIQHGMNKDVVKHAKALRDLGYSLREMEAILRPKGFDVSFSTLSRIFREQDAALAKQTPSGEGVELHFEVNKALTGSMRKSTRNAVETAIDKSKESGAW